MSKIRLDDSCLNHLTNIPVGFTRKSSYIHRAYILRNHIPKILCILLTGGAYAPDATCVAAPLCFIWTSLSALNRHSKINSLTLSGEAILRAKSSVKRLGGLGSAPPRVGLWAPGL